MSNPESVPNRRKRIENVAIAGGLAAIFALGIAGAWLGIVKNAPKGNKGARNTRGNGAAVVPQRPITTTTLERATVTSETLNQVQEAKNYVLSKERNAKIEAALETAGSKLIAWFKPGAAGFSYTPYTETYGPKGERIPLSGRGVISGPLPANWDIGLDPGAVFSLSVSGDPKGGMQVYTALPASRHDSAGPLLTFNDESGKSLAIVGTPFDYTAILTDSDPTHNVIVGDIGDPKTGDVSIGFSSYLDTELAQQFDDKIIKVLDSLPPAA